MKFTLATIAAVAAVLAEAQDMGFAHPGGPFGHHHGGPGGPGKDLICPSPGGVATIDKSCPTGPPPSHSHPHVRPTDAPEGPPHHGGEHGHGHDGTKTVYPAGAPTVTSTHNLKVDCKGCVNVVFAGATCSFEHHHSGSHSHPEPTAFVTLMGATSTKWAKGTPECIPASLLTAGGESFPGAGPTATATSVA